MKVTIRYGNSLDELTPPRCSFTHTEAVNLVREAIRTGHARYSIYVIEAAPEPPAEQKFATAARLAKLKATKERNR